MPTLKYKDSNNTWQKISIVKVGTNANPLPSCSTSNNGQFLRVVNGVATWTTVPSAEGVSV